MVSETEKMIFCFIKVKYFWMLFSHIQKMDFTGVTILQEVNINKKETPADLKTETEREQTEDVQQKLPELSSIFSVFVQVASMLGSNISNDTKSSSGNFENNILFFKN